VDYWKKGIVILLGDILLVQDMELNFMKEKGEHEIDENLTPYNWEFFEEKE